MHSFEVHSNESACRKSGRLGLEQVIKTENNLMFFSDSSWQDCPETGRSTGAYIIFYQFGPIDHGTHVPGLVAQSSAESECNKACIAGMALEHFRMLIN